MPLHLSCLSLIRYDFNFTFLVVKRYGSDMIRQLLAVMLLITLISGNLHAGHDLAVADVHGAGGCSLSVGCKTDAQHPCHDGTDGSHSDHCCDAHSHLQAVPLHQTAVFFPTHDKQFTSVVPHLFPQDFSRIPFIPPRSIS